MRWLAVFAVVPILASYVAASYPVPTPFEGVEHCDADPDDKAHALDGRLINSDEPAPVLSPDDEEEAQRRARQDTTLVALLKTPDFVLLFLAQTLFGFAYFGFLFISMPYARTMGEPGTHYEHADKISVAHAATLLTCYGVASAAGAVLLGLLAARTSNHAVFGGCTVVAACALVGLVFTTRYVELAASFAVIGTCYAGALTCLPSMVVDRFAGPHLNRIMSASFTGFALGGMGGPPIFSALQGLTGASKDYNSALLAGAGALAVAGLVQSAYGVCLWQAQREETADFLDALSDPTATTAVGTGPSFGVVANTGSARRITSGQERVTSARVISSGSFIMAPGASNRAIPGMSSRSIVSGRSFTMA